MKARSANRTADLTSVLRDENKRRQVVFWTLFALLVSDVMISSVAEYIEPQLVSFVSIIFFTITAAVSCFGAYFLLEFIKRKSADIRSRDLQAKLTHKIVTAVQYTLIALILFLLSEILLTSRYDTALLIAIALISEIAALGLLGLFSYRFFSWFRTNRQSLTVLFYGLSFAFNAFSLGVVTAYDATYLPQKESERTPQSEVIYPNTLEPGSLLDILFSLYTYSYHISLGLLVVGTAILLYHYSRKIGKLKFWIIITLPLLYNIVPNIDNFGLYTPSSDSEWFNWLLFGSLNSTALGILFAIAFWTIGKTLRKESAVKQYLNLAVYGFILFFLSTQASPTGAPYPPYGIITMSFLQLTSYMIFLGIYSTAISVAQDNQLRRSIKRIATENSNLLGSIGTAQMEREIQKTVTSMKDVVQEQEKELEEQTGIEANLEEDEMKNYLEEVMQEVSKVKKPST